MSERPIAPTPSPPYYAVIFTSTRTMLDKGYEDTAREMMSLAATQPGYLGIETARDATRGITVSYWRDLDSIKAWKAVAEHLLAQRLGRERWYEAYKTRISKVERDYEFVR